MNWDEPLTHALILKSGERLTTLRDVARELATRFDMPPRWTVLDHAMEAMMRAAESGAHRDIKEATRLIAFVLRQRSLL